MVENCDTVNTCVPLILKVVCESHDVMSPTPSYVNEDVYLETKNSNLCHEKLK